ncbi:MAG: hypothetical protein J1E38_05260 [Paramuribaculum sp.]|nr:hypothetical protein [Paramuribaculum sp.]
MSWNLLKISKKQNRETLKKKLTRIGDNIGIALFDSAIPFVPMGSLLQTLDDSIVCISDYLFYRKLEKFLFPLDSNEVTDVEIENFFKSLGKDNKKITEYLIGLLNNAESGDKTLIMGFIYKAAVKKQISHLEMLRLCSFIDRCFITDLRKLPLFRTPTEGNSIEAMNFINLGLINTYVGGIWKNDDTVTLNQTGLKLLQILNSEHWFGES